jgi:type 1 glutamine amidotransferase
LFLALLMVIADGATAAPPHKALIVDGQNLHDWKGTSPVLKRLLEETGLFTVDVATSPPNGADMSGFQPDFAAYDVVITNYQGDDWPEPTQQAFVDYVAGGGGLVVFHFACSAFPKWEQYNEIIGLGGWGRRDASAGPYLRLRDGKFVPVQEPGRTGGHGPSQPFAVVNHAPDHPIMKGLPPKFMHVSDELYGWLRGPAKNLTVLGYAFAPKDKGGSDEYEPLLFTVTYGKGRVFANMLGHTAEQLNSVAFIVTFQRGAEWAATGKVTQPLPADVPGPDEASVRR